MKLFFYFTCQFKVIATVFSIRDTILQRVTLLTTAARQLVYCRRSSDRAIVFSKADVDSFRYGIDGLRGFFFWIGRIYRIEIRNHEGKIIRIKLWSFYGIGKKRLAEKYTAILDELYAHYFNDMAIHYVRLLDNGLSFSLSGVGLSPHGIDDMKMGYIPWSRVSIRSYYKYYALFDRDHPANYRSFDYGIDWNAAILYAVVHHAAKRQSLRLTPQ